MRMRRATATRPTPLYFAPSSGERVEVCSRCHRDGRRLIARLLDGTITWWCPGCGKFWQAESMALRDS